VKANLLVPDTCSPAAYSTILCLKDFFNRVIIGIPRSGYLSRFITPSANSRFIHRSYYVTNVLSDWFRSFYSQENTDNEEKFLDEIVYICKRENINVIFPTTDPLIFLFSKNERRFSSLNIEVPVPDIQKLSQITDKYSLAVFAKAQNVPCPRTGLVDSASLKNTASTFNFPVILKPRLGLASCGVNKFTEKEELFSKFNYLESQFGRQMLQEFIPGNEINFINVYMNHDCKALACFFYRVQRPEMRVFDGRSGQELAAPNESCKGIVSILERLQFKGYANAQLKVDSRDKIPKLLEINVKMTTNVWMARGLGKNRPLFNYYIYTNKKVDEFKYAYPIGLIILSPVEDVLILLVYLFCILNKYLNKYNPFLKKNTFESLPLLKEIIGHYKIKYSKKSKICNPSLKDFLADPLVFISAWAFYGWKLIKELYPRSFLQ
jgi:hypothetical protein